MTSTTNTPALTTFRENVDRLNRFLQLAKTLDLNDSETLRLKQDFYWQTTTDGVVKFREQAIATDPSLEFDPAKLLREIAKLRKENEEDYVVEQLDLYHRLRAELTLIQLIAIADGYRTEATTLLFQKKTSGLIKHKADIIKLLSDVSSPLSWNDLYDDIIRVAVSNMTRNVKYRGWIEKIKNEFSVTPSLAPIDVDQLEEIIATRNLLSHNGCIVSQDYIERSDAYYKRIGQPAPAIGSQRIIDQVYCNTAINCIGRVIQAIDVEVYRMTI